jgi:hypothetical protein
VACCYEAVIPYGRPSTLIVNRRKAMVSLTLPSGNTEGGSVEVQWLMKPHTGLASRVQYRWQHPATPSSQSADSAGWPRPG